MDWEQAGKLVSLLYAFAPGYTVNEQTVDVWSLALAKVPYEAAQAAVVRWMEERKGFPYPFEIRALAVEDLTGLPAPERAWRLACQRANLPAGHPDLSRPWEVPAAVVDAVHSLGGIRVIRESTAPERLRRDFLDAYAAAYRDAVLAHDFAAPALPEGER